MNRKRKVPMAKLKVAEARQRDVGKGRARLARGAMEAIGAGVGDVLELMGRRLTVSTAWPSDPEDKGKRITRIDGQTRKNAGVALNDHVSVRVASARMARSVTLVPLSNRLSLNREFLDFIKNRLKGMPVVEGDEVSIMILGSPMVFAVSRMRPKAVVKIEQRTRLEILPEPSVERIREPRVTYEEIGGLKEEIRRLREIGELPLRHPEVFQRLGIEPPSGVLLHGPPGCGKTLIAKALAGESKASFFAISGPEIMNRYYGESEARLREIFKEAEENAPSIVFIDELDAIAPKREEVFGDVEKRIVAQLLALMDGLEEREKVIVMGATNRLESIDPALRRPGRFDREVEVGVPNAVSRQEILQIHTRDMPLAKDVDLKRIAEEAYGYSGADLKALCKEAALKALRRHLPEGSLEVGGLPPEVLSKMVVKAEDFYAAGREVVPTALREVCVEKSSVRWEDVGGLEGVKRTLYLNIVEPLKHPERFRKLGVKAVKGVLLYGPPGCGKTMLAKALAAESGFNCITVRGPEVLSKWVGESERAIREVFRKAKASAPCVVLFDEIDSIAKPRFLSMEDSGVGERVLSQILTEMDGLHTVGGIVVIGATNRPDLIDPSLLRPGRLDLLLYIPSPDEGARRTILRIMTARMPLADDVDLEEMARMTKGYTGADLEALCREAGILAFERSGKELRVQRADFLDVVKGMRPSLNPEVEGWYEAFYKQLGRPKSIQFFA